MRLHIKQFGIPECESMSIIDLTRSPCPAVMAGGLGGVGHGQYFVTDESEPVTAKSTVHKPPYCVPTMAEIRDMPWNGYTVASTFSGAGGSCTGYRMAGFRVLWSNEFVPAAQDSYKANCAKYSFLDRRDIRLVQAEDILKQTGLQQGELDVFDGSPPCQAFSTAGKRDKGWGKQKSYEHGAKQCNEQLFDEYIRLLRGLMPRVFIAENVSGLVKGKAKGYFLQILRDLKASGYRVRCKVLDAQWLGVPQQRQRTIFIGVRNDLNTDPVFPSPLPYRYSVRDALPGIAKAIQDPKGQFAVQEASDRPCFAIKAGSSSHCTVRAIRIADGFHAEKWIDAGSRPSPTIGTAPSFGCNINGNGGKAEFVDNDENTERRKFTIAELKRICAFPDDFILCGSYSQQWERLGNSVPPVMMRAIAEVVRDEILRKVDAK